MLLCMIFGYVEVYSQIIYSDNVIWGTNQRPSWSGSVMMEYNPNVRQITSVEGIVIPCGTSGRPSAPNPYNGYPTGNDYGLDKGHIMALSNGGSDESRNIVPQAAQWQRTGGWRRLEIDVYEFAAQIYGWSNNIPHASEVSSISRPISTVLFHVDIALSDYDGSTGEPLAYNGWVRKEGNNPISFYIETLGTAQWFPCKPSLSCQGSRIMSNYTGMNTTNIITTTVNATNISTTIVNTDIISDNKDGYTNKFWIPIIIIACIIIILLIGYYIWKRYIYRKNTSIETPLLACNL